MTNKNVCYDQQTIHLFLNEELEPEQLAEFSAHLDECPDCRLALDGVAADANFWEETVQYLGTEGRKMASSVDTASEFEINEDSTDANSDPVIQSILQCLAPTDDPEMIGRIGEYEISGIVGMGGMGAVLKGFDKSLMRVVAIKMMAPHLANKGTARKRFEREARAAAAISHDNVIDIYRVDEINGVPYLVMPFARGPSLQRRIERGGPLSTIEVVQVGRQIAAGLAAAHEQGLVHRDIKPANLLLNDGIERILITDFGVARVMDDVSMTQTGLVAGTPQYMSPEQARGESVDQRSDLFSLGALLYTACTGRPPFRADAPFGILRKITDTHPTSILEINPEIPSWLVAVIDHLLEKSPDNRFQSAKQVSETFEKCLAHLRQPKHSPLPKSVQRLPLQSPLYAKSKPSINIPSKWAIAFGVLAIGLLGALGLFKLTDAPNISGKWGGDSWTQIELKSVANAEDWYAGNFVDPQGNKGAIHLEWSRLNRRFEGRWSVGSHASGTIVLKKRRQQIRGAIMLDSDASTADSTRLRDFEWDPSRFETAGPSAPSAVGFTSADPLETTPQNSGDLFAKVDGVVSIVGDFKNGSRVQKGDLILEIKNIEVVKAKKELETVQGQLVSVNDYFDAVSKQVQSLMEAKELTDKKSKLAVKRAKVNLDAKADAFEYEKNKLRQFKNKHARAKALFEEGVSSVQDVDNAKAELANVEAAVEKAAKEIDLAHATWEEKKAEIQLAEVQRQADIDTLMVARVEVSNNRSALQDAAKKLNEQIEQSILRIHAPSDGIISNWGSWQPNQAIKQGDRVATLIIAEKETTNQPPRDAKSFNIGTAPELISYASELEKRMALLNSSTYDLQAQITSLQDARAQHEARLDQLQKQLAKANKSQLANLKAEINASKFLLDTATDKVNTCQTSLDNCVAQRELVKRDWNTALQSLQLEMDSCQAQIKLAADFAKIQRALYDQGDISLAEIEPADSRLETLQTKGAQLKTLLKRFNSIFPNESAKQ